MKPKIALSVLALCSFGLVNVFGQTAPKRTFTSSYYFGDSLTDNGNTFAVTSAPPINTPTPPSPTYYMGRFSNGMVYSEYLSPGLVTYSSIAAGITNPANINFAFAGATAASAGTLPTLTAQVGLFQGRTITNNSNSLFVVIAGANDLLDTIATPATRNTTAVEAAANAAATAVGTNVRSLIGLGAKTVIVMNLPDLSVTPRFTTGSRAADNALGATGSATFNSAIQTNLASANLAADVNLRLIDLNGILTSILQNSQALGFTNTTSDVVTTLASGGTVANPNSYVFYDDVHATNAVHQLLASALTETINPEFVLGTADTQRLATQTLSDLGTDAIDQRLSYLRRRESLRGDADAFISYNSRTGNFYDNAYTPDFRVNAQVITAGIDHQYGENWLAGIAFNNNQVDSNLGSALGSNKIKGNSITAYGLWTDEDIFVEGNLTFGTHDIDNIKRATSLGGLNTTAQTQGNQIGGSLKIGRSFEYKTAHVTQFVGLRMQNTTIDGYSEQGVDGLNFQFDKQSINSFSGLIGMNGDWKLDIAGSEITLGLGAIYQADRGSGDSRNISGRLADTVATSSSVQTEEGLGDTLKLRASLSGSINETWGWQASYTNDRRSKADSANQYSITIRRSF